MCYNIEKSAVSAARKELIPMSLLFFGYFLLLLRYDLTIAGFTFDILFDFVGYLILAKAAAELAAESSMMKKTELPCKLLALLSLAVTVLDGLKLLSVIPIVKSVAIMAISFAVLALLYVHIKGISEIEQKSGYDMKTHKIRRDWMILAIAMVFSRISMYPTITIVASYANLVFSVILLLDLNTAIKGYNGKVMAPVKDETTEAETKKNEPAIAFSAAESEEDDG